MEFYKKNLLTPKIIKAELTSRHLNDTLADGLKSKKIIDWPRILLIYMTFESPQYTHKCLFLLIEKATAMICFLSLQLTHKDNILYYKAVKIMINPPNFVEVILNVIKRHRNLLDLVTTNRISLLLV